MSHRQTRSSKRLKVLSIAHSAISEAGRLRYHTVAKQEDIQLKLIVPRRWREFGRSIEAEAASGPLDIQAEPIRLSHAGPAHWYLHFYPALSGILDELQPDVLHLWEEPWSMVAVQAARLCSTRFRNTALLIETDQNILRHLPPPFELMRRYTLARTNALIGRQLEAVEVCRSCGFEGPAIPLDFCVDTDRFYPNERDKARAELGAKGLILGYAGRLIKEKGLFTILEALRKCKRPASLCLLGEGPERHALEKKAKALGLEDRVHFHPKGSPDDVARFMNGLDVFVLMSETTRTWKEQFGRVIIEAQACGTPVIGSDSGAIPSVLDKGGWIVAESNAGELAKLIDDLASDPGKVQTASIEGLRNTRARYSRDRVATKLWTAFQMADASNKHKTGELSPLLNVES